MYKWEMTKTNTREMLDLTRPLIEAPNELLFAICKAAEKFIDDHDGIENIEPIEFMKMSHDVRCAMDEIGIRN